MSDSRHIMLAIGLFLAVILLGGVGLIVPNAREVRDIRERVTDLTERSEGVEQTTEEVEQLSRMLAEARQTIETELKIIPEESGVTSMIRQLSLTIDRQTVLDQTFTVGSRTEPLPEAYPDIRAVPVTMEMKSTFGSVYAVLRAVESMERMVRLRTLRFRASDQPRVNQYGDPIVETVLVLEAVYEDVRD